MNQSGLKDIFCALCNNKYHPHPLRLCIRTILVFKRKPVKGRYYCKIFQKFQICYVGPDTTSSSAIAERRVAGWVRYGQK